MIKEVRPHGAVELMDPTIANPEKSIEVCQGDFKLQNEVQSITRFQVAWLF